MKRKFVAFTAILMAVVLLLSACSPTEPATPEPSPEPTEIPTEETVAAPTEETATANDELPVEPGICEVVDMTLPVSPVTEDDWVKSAGDGEAEITLIEYADFQCPGCSAVVPILDEFLKAHPNIRLVYRHFPLSFHDKAMVTAETVEAAGAQGKFWEMYNLLFGRVDEWNALSVDEARVKMSDYAEELGLDVEQFDRELDEDVHVPKIEAQLQESQDIQLPGTPSFVFEGLLYPTQQYGLSYQGLEAFLPVLDSLLALRERQYAEIPAMTVDSDAEYVVTLTTTKGDIVVSLLPNVAPTHVNNFLFLAREGWYDNTEFFFVQEGFAAVAGDPTNTGNGAPGYYCGGEVQGTFDRAGLFGMVPNGQFFFSLGADAASLSGNFPLIGEVIEGKEVIEQLVQTAVGVEGVTRDRVESVTIVEN
ncbi:MAG: peptidylprolyl isomerase [Anaerolineae bacterium]|nr:peptidylprolyl isomerase [Anaerolineae bacterium]